MAFRISWAAVCFGKPFLGETNEQNDANLVRSLIFSNLESTASHRQHHWPEAQCSHSGGWWLSHHKTVKGITSVISRWKVNRQHVKQTTSIDSRLSHLPLPMEGKATDLSFFSSARARQFFTVLSSSSSHLSEPQPGLLQWMTYLAGRPKPEVSTAAAQRKSES